MEKKEFRDLLARCAETTQNIRVFNDWRYSGVYRVSDEITAKIDCLVTLLQAKVDEGYFCKKDEYLLIYNFQPLFMSDETCLCSLDMVIKPLKEINELGNNNGKPLQLVVNGTTGEVGNNAYGLAVIMDEATEEVEEELEIEGEKPFVYGNYNDAVYFLPLLQDFVTKLNQLRGTIEAFTEPECKEKEIDPQKGVENRPAIRFSVQKNTQTTKGFDRVSAQEPWAESSVKASPPRLIRQVV